MEYWSETYEQARESFINRARRRGHLFHLPVESKTFPDELEINIVWIGNPNVEKVLLVQSGVHGVEAFAGSAVQNAYLDQISDLESSTAVVLVHVLNPYGMKALRRVNENNVDLNRNCNFDDFAKLKEHDGEYGKLDQVLNPRTKKQDYLFWPKILIALARYGYSSLSQAIAQGQYSIDDGIFFGGRELQQETRVFHAWAKERLGKIKQLVVIDLHTGLGKFAEQIVISESPAEETNSRSFVKNLPSDVKVKTVTSGETYGASGSFRNLYAHALPEVHADFYTVEFGTYVSPIILRALSEENRGFHAGDNIETFRKSFLQKFTPDNKSWKTAVVKNGLALLVYAYTKGFENRR